MKNTKRNFEFMAILFAALALFVGIFLVANPVIFSPKADVAGPTYTKIQGDDDLDRATKTLNSYDLNLIDTRLNQNTQDASSF